MNHLEIFKSLLEQNARAWFSATKLCNFFGHHPDDIVFYGLNEPDIKIIKSSLSMYRGT